MKLNQILVEHDELDGMSIKNAAKHIAAGNYKLLRGLPEQFQTLSFIANIMKFMKNPSDLILSVIIDRADGDYRDKIFSHRGLLQFAIKQHPENANYVDDKFLTPEQIKFKEEFTECDSCERYHIYEEDCENWCEYCGLHQSGVWDCGDPTEEWEREHGTDCAGCGTYFVPHPQDDFEYCRDCEGCSACGKMYNPNHEHDDKCPHCGVKN